LFSLSKMTKSPDGSSDSLLSFPWSFVFFGIRFSVNRTPQAEIVTDVRGVRDGFQNDDLLWTCKCHELEFIDWQIG
jgi:hypothetical protein